MTYKETLYNSYRDGRARMYAAGAAYVPKPAKPALAPDSVKPPRIVDPAVENGPVQVSLHALLAASARAAGVKIEELTSGRRYHRLTRARYVFFSLAEIHTNQSNGQISKLSGGYHRTVVTHASRQIKANPLPYQDLLSKVRQELSLNWPSHV